MIKQRKVELLAPTKNLECGMVAIDHGTDTVYISVPKFGAHTAAVNSLGDMAASVEYTYLYSVRIYAAVNAVLKDEELKETEEMIRILYRIGADALTVRDMGIAGLESLLIPLCASTQIDDRMVEKVRFLAGTGFRQVVLARELSLRKIGKTHEACPDVPLEIFVRGAFCASYSGQCCVSQACFGHSANRGEYARFCRSPFSLVDSNDRVIVKDKHLLSLKDLDQSKELEALLDTGASSFRIKGRLKNISYVKNVAAARHQKLNAIPARRKEYVRASSDSCRYAFNPQLDESFSRGFTHYFLHGRTRDVFSLDTPKLLGEEMGTMKEARGGRLTVAGLKSFNDSDGACYVDKQGKLQGFRINRAEGDRLYLQEMLRIKPRTVLYHGFDQKFGKIPARRPSERKMAVTIRLVGTAFGLALTLTDEGGNRVALSLLRTKEPARTSREENLKTQLAKLGDTSFEAECIGIDFTENWFLPASVLADFRRRAIEKLIAARRVNYRRELAVLRPTTRVFPQTMLTYPGNVMNVRAASFYAGYGAADIAPALEQTPVEKTALMLHKYCLRYNTSWCSVHQRERPPYREPYYLVSIDGKRFRLESDYWNYQMKVSVL